jgi:hypothetical protein
MGGAEIHPVLILQMLLLLTLANGTPVIAKRVFGDFAAWPVDGGCRFVDGKPLFGSSKTIRGVALSILITSALAPVVGLPWKLGAIVGTTAMAGDLLSSFLKRRMNRASSAMAIGLDQVPESLLPLLACRQLLGITILDMLIVVVVFFVGALILSRLLFQLKIRDRPF